jgi:predicted ArsR family transcriptional regulator
VLEIFTDRQRKLLTLLLKEKSGLTVDELSSELAITRNAVRQHLASLEVDGLVELGATRPSGGRPQQLYVLSKNGKEVFPRHYSWFAQLVLESVIREHGADGLGERLNAIGSDVAAQLSSQYPTLQTGEERIGKLAELMDELGYSARNVPAVAGEPVIEADNCVFHELAVKNPDICRFDLAMMSAFTDSTVDHQECMARGANVCRFKFSPK